MVKYFITVCCGVITDVHSGDINADFFGTVYYGHERVEIPKEAVSRIRAKDRVEFYDQTWNRKSDIRLIDEELLPLPEGYVREGDDLRKMTKEERVTAGLDEPPAGQKLDEEGELVPMTLQERVEAGQITQGEYRQLLAAANESELNRRLAALQTPEALARAEINEEYAAERKAKLTALLAVKEQEGWPVTAEWPAEDEVKPAH